MFCCSQAKASNGSHNFNTLAPAKFRFGSACLYVYSKMNYRAAYMILVNYYVKVTSRIAAIATDVG